MSPPGPVNARDRTYALDRTRRCLVSQTDHETGAKMQNVAPGHGRVHRIRYSIDHLWNKTIVVLLRLGR